MDEVKKLRERVKRLQKQRADELEGRLLLSSCPTWKNSFGRFPYAEKIVNEKYKRRIALLQHRIEELMRNSPAEDSDEVLDREDVASNLIGKRKRANRQDDVIEINSDSDIEEDNFNSHDAHLKDDAADYNEYGDDDDDDDDRERISSSSKSGESSNDEDINAPPATENRERLVIEIDLESDEDLGQNKLSHEHGKGDNYISNKDVNGEDEVVAEGGGHSVIDHGLLASEDFMSDHDDISSDEEDDEDIEELEKVHVSEIKQSKLTMAAQGFRSQLNSGSKEQIADTRACQTNRPPFDPLFVVYRGKTFRKNHCYILRGVNAIIMGIQCFVSSNSAKCIMIARFEDTFLGLEDKETNVDHEFTGAYVQVHQCIDTIDLDRFIEDADSVTVMPSLIYQDRTPGSWHTFGYFYDRAERMQSRGKKRLDIRSLEIFAGAGGSLFGYKNNGFTTVMAVENDEDAVRTLQLNHPGLNIYAGCVKKFVTDYEMLKCALGRIDHIHFSSPCQDFSKANRHQSHRRDRADLSLLLVDLVRVTSCSTAVFENVMGLLDSRSNVQYLKRIAMGLMKLGYQIRSTCLRACDYGDPQIRPRFFMFIAKNSVPMPSFPAKTHGPHNWNFVTVKEALCLVKDNALLLHNLEGRTTSLKPGQHGHARLMPHKCAPTIRASSVTPFHYSEDRLITVREAACLQSFPIDYKFSGSVRSQYRQVGNAVPIELSMAVAQSIRQILLFEYNNDKKTLNLAEPEISSH